MKDKSDSDYEDFISYLRYVCFNPRCFPDVMKTRKMLASGELKSIDEAKEWLKMNGTNLSLYEKTTT
ncbi:MAG: hypothetical protein IJM42_02915 [Synergistes sp.]|nr:hypothetical protein [bacterium]MBQ9881544.1 hypothetical protein [Synergistes sp.]